MRYTTYSALLILVIISCRSATTVSGVLNSYFLKTGRLSSYLSDSTILATLTDTTISDKNGEIAFSKRGYSEEGEATIDSLLNVMVK